MTESEGLKEVYFEKYCKTCEHWGKTPAEDPCCDCLDEPVNQYSHKPVRYEERVKNSR